MVLVHQINGNKWVTGLGTNRDQQVIYYGGFFFLKPNSKNKTSGSCSGDGEERKGLHIESKV